MIFRSLPFLRGLCLVLFIWATLSSYFLWKNSETQNPRLQQEQMFEQSTQTSKSVQSLENVGFLRQFLEQFFTYNSSNFWQTQTALAFSMESNLRQNRLSEIERLRPKLSMKEYAQKARLLRMNQRTENQFDAVLEVQMSDAGKENVLFIQVDLKLHAVPRSVENPWGREVLSLALKTDSTNPLLAQTKTISMAPESPLLLAFHCAVENIRLAKDSPVIAKMTTMNVSEIQILIKDILSNPTLAGANCKEQSFELELAPAQDSATIFLDVSDRFLKPRFANAGKKKNNPYHKTLEDQLDFIMEE